jgi:hypothetical protein
MRRLNSRKVMSRCQCLNVWVAMVAACAMGSGYAQEPRLALWVGDSIGATNAAHCRTTVPPQGPPDLTELDVLAWDFNRSTWTVDATKMNAEMRPPANRCFVLQLDGKQIHGVTLLPNSARLIRFPTLVVDGRQGLLTFQLNASHEMRTVPLARAELDAILSNAGSR